MASVWDLDFGRVCTIPRNDKSSVLGLNSLQSKVDHVKHALPLGEPANGAH